MAEPQILKQDDPLVRAIDNECNAALTALVEEYQTDPTGICVAMAMMLLRQIATIDQPRAAKVARAISQEIASNWTDPAATERRVMLTLELAALGREKARAMAEANQARAAGQIS